MSAGTRNGDDPKFNPNRLFDTDEDNYVFDTYWIMYFRQSMRQFACTSVARNEGFNRFHLFLFWIILSYEARAKRKYVPKSASLVIVTHNIILRDINHVKIDFDSWEHKLPDWNLDNWSREVGLSWFKSTYDKMVHIASSQMPIGTTDADLTVHKLTNTSGPVLDRHVVEREDVIDGIERLRAGVYDSVVIPMNWYTDRVDATEVAEEIPSFNHLIAIVLKRKCDAASLDGYLIETARWLCDDDVTYRNRMFILSVQLQISQYVKLMTENDPGMHINWHYDLWCKYIQGGPYCAIAAQMVAAAVAYDWYDTSYEPVGWSKMRRIGEVAERLQEVSMKCLIPRMREKFDCVKVRHNPGEVGQRHEVMRNPSREDCMEVVQTIIRCVQTSFNHPDGSLYDIMRSMFTSTDRKFAKRDSGDEVYWPAMQKYKRVRNDKRQHDDQTSLASQDTASVITLSPSEQETHRVAEDRVEENNGLFG